jgi:ammonium transporter, Amt family
MRCLGDGARDQFRPPNSNLNIDEVQTTLNQILIYCVPIGVLLIAVGAFEERRVARAATVATIAFALAVLFYGFAGFGLQFGGIGLVNDALGLKSFIREWSPLDVIVGRGWGVTGLDAFAVNLGEANADVVRLFLYNAALAGTAVMLPILALAARIQSGKSRVLLFGAVVLSILLYPLAGNWIWGGGWLSQMGNTSGLGHGTVDYGGSGAVFVFGGLAALGGLLGYGARTHTEVTTAANIPEFPSAHLPLLMILGAFLFLFGIAVAGPFAPKDLPTTLILFNLVNAAAAGVVVATLYGWFVSGEPSAMLAARGAVAGGVAVAASLPFVPGWSALIIGGLAGLLVPLSTYVVDRWIRVQDDGLIVSTFGTAGMWGLLALAIFADGHYGIGWNGTGLTKYLGVANQGVTGIFALSGFVPDSPGQMEAQFFGVIAIGLLAFLTSWAIFYVMRRIAGKAE